MNKRPMACGRRAEMMVPANVGDAEPQDTTRLTIPGDQFAVRDGLRALFDTILLRSLAEDDRGAAEIVLAEALNNIVEHAYSNSLGEIDISLQLRQNELVCTIVDTGSPMPNEELPTGRLGALSNQDELPEGGFGWHLIRTLSKDLKYCREGGRNLLSFRLDTAQSRA
jgi:serine/threonine-protein kinase RsbW